MGNNKKNTCFKNFKEIPYKLNSDQAEHLMAQCGFYSTRPAHGAAGYIQEGASPAGKVE